MNVKHLKRTVGLILVIVMVFGLVATFMGCGKKTKTAKENPVKDNVDKENEIEEENKLIREKGFEILESSFYIDSERKISYYNDDYPDEDYSICYAYLKIKNTSKKDIQQGHISAMFFDDNDQVIAQTSMEHSIYTIYDIKAGEESEQIAVFLSNGKPKNVSLLAEIDFISEDSLINSQDDFEISPPEILSDDPEFMTITVKNKREEDVHNADLAIIALKDKEIRFAKTFHLANIDDGYMKPGENQYRLPILELSEYGLENCRFLIINSDQT